MKEEYHFCFVFNKILLLDDIQKQLNQRTRFKFELIKRNRLLGRTNDIPASPLTKELPIDNHFIRLRVEEKDLASKEVCEIRLIQAEEDEERLIGRYEFVLNNYVVAYNDLHRSCVELSVEIGENFTIEYEVFLERTTQALKRIIDEHSAAKKLSTNDSNEEDEDFYFPHQESTFSNGPPESKILRLNSEGKNNLLPPQKMYSPKEQKLLNFSRQKSKIDNFSSTFAAGDKPLSPSESRPHMLKLSRAETSVVETEPEEKSSQIAMSQTMQHVTEEEVESNMEREEDDKNLQELYLVIQKESKVYLPGENDNYSLYKPVTAEPAKTHIDTRDSLNQICKKSDPIRTLKQALLLVFLLLFAGLLLSNAMQPTRRAKPRRSVKH